MKFSLVVAMDDHNGIGKANALAWHLSADLKHFAALTKGNGNNAVIMGSNTWRSIPDKFRPLPGRLNVVLSRQVDLEFPAGVLLFNSLDQALDNLETKQIDEVLVIGGAQVYAEAINHPDCQTIYLTKVFGDFQCEVFFPKLPDYFKLVSEGEIQTEGDLKFQFLVYQTNPA
jgi:dihydrofolate reductase